MPPKLQKLKEQLKKQKKPKRAKKKKEIKLPAPKVEKPVMGLFAIQQKEKEEQKIREFFTRIKGLAPREMLEAIENFTAEPGAPASRTYFTNLVYLSKKLIKQYIDEYLAQDKKSAQDMLEAYLQAPKVQQKLLQYQEKEEEEERERLKKERQERKLELEDRKEEGEK